MKILVLNEGYSDNLGDQAINISINNLIKSLNKTNIIFHDFTRNRDSIKQMNAIERHKNVNILRKVIKAIIPVSIIFFLKNFVRIKNISKNKYDLVIIGGGQLILSNEVFPLSLAMWIFFLRKNENKNIKMFAVGAGENYTYISQKLYTYSLERTKRIYVRDENSRETLKKEYFIDTDFVYDVAYTFDGLKKNDYQKSNKFILVGITSFSVYNIYNKNQISKSQYYEKWIKIMEDNNLNKNNIKLFYTTSVDKEEVYNFKKYFKLHYNIDLEIINTDTLNSLIDLYKNGTIVLSGRMHALILGYIYNCHIITFPISHKLLSFEHSMEDKETNLQAIKDKVVQKMKECIDE